MAAAYIAHRKPKGFAIFLPAPAISSDHHMAGTVAKCHSAGWGPLVAGGVKPLFRLIQPTPCRIGVFNTGSCPFTMQPATGMVPVSHLLGLCRGHANSKH
jgi:hypothetical protein